MRTTRTILMWSVAAAFGVIGGLPGIATAQTARAELNPNDFHECYSRQDFRGGPLIMQVNPRIEELTPVREAQRVWARWTLYVSERWPGVAGKMTPVGRSNYWRGTAIPGNAKPGTWTEMLYNQQSRQYREGNSVVLEYPNWPIVRTINRVRTELFAKVEYIWQANTAYQANVTKEIWASVGNRPGNCLIQP